MIRDEDGLEWASEPKRVCYAFRVGGKPISPAQAVKLSKAANISTAVLRCKATFTDMMRSLLSYARATEENYGVRSVDVRIVDIVGDMKYLGLLAANSRTTYIRYVRVGR